jgi:hypothetical protein
MKSNNNNNNDDDDDDDDDDDNKNNTAMGSVHARGDTFLTFGLKALTETNTSRLATASYSCHRSMRCAIALTKQHIAIPFISDPALGWNRGRTYKLEALSEK